MKFYVDESDKRCAAVASALRLEKKTVEATVAEDPKLFGADDVVIFAPSHKLSSFEAERFLTGSAVFCGACSEEVKTALAGRGVRLVNFLDDEELSRKNALLTAEALLAEILIHTERSLFGQKYLVVGYGRVAKAIAEVFSKLALHFSVAVFKKPEFDDLEAIAGRRYFGYEFLPEMNTFDVVLNTIPARVFGAEMCSQFGGHLTVLEVASVDCLVPPPNSNFKYIRVPALPKKYTPKSAAELMMKTIRSKL